MNRSPRQKPGPGERETGEPGQGEPGPAGGPGETGEPGPGQRETGEPRQRPGPGQGPGERETGEPGHTGGPGQRETGEPGQRETGGQTGEPGPGQTGEPGPAGGPGPRETGEPGQRYTVGQTGGPGQRQRETGEPGQRYTGGQTGGPGQRQRETGEPGQRETGGQTGGPGPSRPPAKSRGRGVFSWVRGRSLGRGLGPLVEPGRETYCIRTSLYRSMNPAGSVPLSTKTHGAAFNLEYSPDGSVLTVACEQTEVLLFDPVSSKHIKTLSEAHEDCVNNIRFLDNRLFATCSDDTTVALWDLRNLNTKVCTLHGHTSWVKNIEYDTNTRLLVTSGFDGNVITWDTNRCTEDGCPHKKFFHTRYLMRMRLTPDCSKMLISTSSGYLLILHDLDLTQALEVSSYRSLRGKRSASNTDLTTSSCSLPGLRSQNHEIGTSQNSEKIPSHSCAQTEREAGFPRNSLEVLTPEIPAEKDRGNCITSLQLHPKGWATLIRCTSNTDDQEWTCIYEFQDGPPVRASSPRCSLSLTHYIEEANVGRGYIKELCFSPDGRLICSPFGYGIRLLGFDSQCNELCDCLPREATALQEIRTIYSHSDVVLTTKFSPTHCQLASGCLSGQVYLYQPKF